MTLPSSKNFIAWIILISLSIVWGASFILIKKSLLAFDGIQVGLARVSISFICFIPFLIKALKAIDRKKWFDFFLVGLTGNMLPGILFPLAEVKIDSGIAGVLNSMTPIFTIIFAFLIWKQKSSITKVIGIFLGFFGTSWLLLVNDSGFSISHLPYGLLIILATMCYGISANLVQHRLKSYSPLVIATLAFSSIGPPSLIYLVGFTDFISLVSTHESGWLSLSAVSILAVLGTVISTLLFYKLVKMTDAIFASLVAFLIPIVALILGVLDGEIILLLQMVGIIAIFGGIYMVKKR